jgi:hypothetical protein
MDKMIQIDDICKGYNSFDKLNTLYFELTGNWERLLESKTPLITIHRPNWRGDAYKWELFKYKDSQILLEIFFGEGGYADHYMLPPKISKSRDDSRAKVRFLQVHIMNTNRDIEAEVVGLMKKYRKLEMPEYEYYASYHSCPICGENEEDNKKWKDSKCPNCGWSYKSAHNMHKVEVKHAKTA